MSQGIRNNNGQLDSRLRGSRSTICSVNVCTKIFNPDFVLGSEKHTQHTREINRQDKQPEGNYRQVIYQEMKGGNYA